LIGAVGRLADEKGFDRLILAVDRLLNRGARVRLAIAGEGERRAALESLIGERNRRDKIQLLGYRRDVPELLQAMDVFVLSSLREGLPNVLLEAMAMEVPVVATRINGIPRIVAHRGNGLLVEPDNVGELAAGLDLLLTNAEMQRRLAAAARATVVDRYGFAARMDKVSGIYRQVLTRSRGRARGSSTK
jgi:glycosyltransferase involved in cell wall biosynthesis